MGFCRIWGVAALVALIVGCSPAQSQVPPSTELSPSISVHLLLGNPSGATPTKLTPDNYLMVKNQYALSYNNSKGTANWVAWQLNKSWLGDAERQNNFRPDNTLPAGWLRVTPSMYSGSGYDRGHIAPSGDRTRTVEDNSSRSLFFGFSSLIFSGVQWRSAQRTLPALHYVDSFVS
ncbi:DNA/RNA non-specific endonuclease [Nostoc parmelioides]|uniref:DNA/RNA non-specific endonuclease n=1 Tax=Nostoc parmelioides TaxID=1521621 RepID=UPI003BAE7BAC